jgi:drug/metabolite transporter (DMT)-like permease
MSEYLAVLYILIAFLFVSIMSALGKAMGETSPGLLVFFQNSVALLVFTPWFLRNGISALKTKRLGLHLLRATSGLLSQGFMFEALKSLPLMSAVLLSNSAPLFIPLIAWTWLKQKSGPNVWLSLIIGFIGVIFILRPGASTLENPSALVPLVASILSAFALLSVNQLSKSESTEKILFYYFLISTLLTAPYLFISKIHFNLPHIAFLTGIGLSMAISQLMIILAYRHSSASQVAPFNYSVVIFSGLLGWIFWNDHPTLFSLIGVILVSIGGILSTKLSPASARGHFGWMGHHNIEQLRLEGSK